MNDQDKVRVLVRLAKLTSPAVVIVEELQDAFLDESLANSDRVAARRARRSVFMARKAGMVLKPIRGVAGAGNKKREVVSYEVLSELDDSTISTVYDLLKPKRQSKPAVKKVAKVEQPEPETV